MTRQNNLQNYISYCYSKVDTLASDLAYWCWKNGIKLSLLFILDMVTSGDFISQSAYMQWFVYLWFGQWVFIYVWSHLHLTHCGLVMPCDVMNLGQHCFGYRKTSNIRCAKSPNSNVPRLVENEDVVGAAPIGGAPTLSEWSTGLLPTKVRLMLDVWQ